MERAVNIATFIKIEFKTIRSFRSKMSIGF